MAPDVRHRCPPNPTVRAPTLSQTQHQRPIQNQALPTYRNDTAEPQDGADIQRFHHTYIRQWFRNSTAYATFLVHPLITDIYTGNINDKPHKPSNITPNDSRILFISNVPTDTNEDDMRTLFTERLGGARVVRVDLDSSAPAAITRKH